LVKRASDHILTEGLRFVSRHPVARDKSGVMVTPVTASALRVFPRAPPRRPFAG